jgi:hypothetical protein
MRDRYYRVTSASEVPHKAVLVHVYRRLGQVLARLDGDDEADEAQPDLILFRAALERLRQDLVGTFVLLEDDALWQADWGNLIDYRGGRESEGPALHEAPALIIEPDLSEAWDFILSRFRTAKPRPLLREAL